MARGEEQHRNPKTNIEIAQEATMRPITQVAADKLDEYRDRLREAGVEVTDVVHHQATGPDGQAEIVRSIFFRDPDGIVLEFSAWTGAEEPDDARRHVSAEV